MNFAEKLSQSKVLEYSNIFELGLPCLKAKITTRMEDTLDFMEQNNIRYLDFIENNKQRWEVHSNKDLHYLLEKFEGIHTVIQERPDALWLNGFAYWNGSEVVDKFLYLEDSHIVAGNLGRISLEPQICSCWPDVGDIFGPQYIEAVKLLLQNNCENVQTYIYFKTARLGDKFETPYLYEFGYSVPDILLKAQNSAMYPHRETDFLACAVNVHCLDNTQYVFAASGKQINDCWDFLYSQVRQSDLLFPYYRIDGVKKTQGCYNQLVKYDIIGDKNAAHFKKNARQRQRNRR